MVTQPEGDEGEGGVARGGGQGRSINAGAARFNRRTAPAEGARGGVGVFNH